MDSKPNNALATSNPPMIGKVFLFTTEMDKEQFRQLLPKQSWIEVPIDSSVSFEANAGRASLIYSSATRTFSHVFYTDAKLAQWQLDTPHSPLDVFGHVNVNRFAEWLRVGKQPWVVLIENGKAVSSRPAESLREIELCGEPNECCTDGLFYAWAETDVEAVEEIETMKTLFGS